MGWLHSKWRNRLAVSILINKLIYINIIIFFINIFFNYSAWKGFRNDSNTCFNATKLKQKKIEEDALKFWSTDIALPVNENEDQNSSDDLNVSDDESSNELIETDANVQTGNNWRNIVSRWINMLEYESNEENDNDSESDSNDDDEELEINVANISNLPHPARDQNSKWKLQDIFIESLGEPNYLSAFMLGNN